MSDHSIEKAPPLTTLRTYSSGDPTAGELGRDDALLASLGYKAELKREFNALEVFGLAFSIMGLLPSIASTLVYSMPNGGPVGMVGLLCLIVIHSSLRYGDGSSSPSLS